MISRALIAGVALVALANAACAECLPSAAAVWTKHPGSHASWIYPGHKVGPKCWFAGTRKEVRRDAGRSDRSSDRASLHKESIVSRPLSATGAAPPRAMPEPDRPATFAERFSGSR